MFGVDSTGKDILAPQFSHNSREARKSPGFRPGSSIDYEIRLSFEIRRLSNDEVFVDIMREEVLYEMFQKGMIMLPMEYLENAKETIINMKFNEWKFKFQHSVESQDKNRLMMPLAISPGSILREISAQKQINEMALKKQSDQVRKNLETKYSIDDPELIKRALVNLYNEGLLFAKENDIQRLINVKIEQKASEVAKNSIRNEATMASRSAVLRMMK